MRKKIDIGQKAKVEIDWVCQPATHSKEEERNIAVRLSKKYGIPEKNINVVPTYITSNGDNTALNADNIHDIHDPKFQQELFKQWLNANGITDYDYDELIKIDSQINTLIDYSSYEKGQKYRVKWLRWSNFLSYGPDNYFDFTQLHGLVLLNGEPANKSGKSTFAYDLLHFLLFGKTKSGKAKNFEQLFNNYLPDENNLKVEGGIEINGENYIIRRSLTRPDRKKKTKLITQKVEYFRVLDNGIEEELPDTDNCQAESTTKTSKIIKEAIGTEEDFDLIISASAKDLDDLITLKDTERGRILSRWIGLSCLEDKDARAREKWNKDITVGRYCDIYNRETLSNEIKELEKENNGFADNILKETEKINEAEKRINDNNGTRDTLLLSKRNIDPELCKIDLPTLDSRLSQIAEKGQRDKSTCVQLEEKINSFGEIIVDENHYSELRQKNETIINEIGGLKSTITMLRKQCTDLTNAEYCPTCHRKFDNVDNTAFIEKINSEIKELIAKGVELDKCRKENAEAMSQIESDRQRLMEKNKYELKLTALKADLESQRNEYKDKLAIKKSRKEYDASISENNRIDAQIRVIDENIKVDKKIVEAAKNAIFTYRTGIETNKKSIVEKNGQINKIEEELRIEKNWKIYLQLVGKDGISKMVLRNSLPIINGELKQLLNDVADFDVEVEINDKNDIEFWLIRDGIKTRLAGASGLERTQASLALRVILGKMCNLSKPPFVLFDEILGTVAKENYDDMKKLYDKIVPLYDFVLHITHLTDIVDWHEMTVTCKKENNISSIKAIN